MIHFTVLDDGQDRPVLGHAVANIFPSTVELGKRVMGMIFLDQKFTMMITSPPFLKDKEFIDFVARCKYQFNWSEIKWDGRVDRTLATFKVHKVKSVKTTYANDILATKVGPPGMFILAKSNGLLFPFYVRPGPRAEMDPVINKMLKEKKAEFATRQDHFNM